MLTKALLLLYLWLPSLSFGISPVLWSEAVEIGGIKQWITAKGTSDKNPILLFLHGGPGNSVMSIADRFTKELQNNFVVVMWDQRESGQTAKLNLVHPELSLELLEEDVVEVVNFLRRRFSQDKIYLAGHSWGAFLALTLAISSPGLLEACFAISPMVNQLESERLTLHWMKEVAKGALNNEAIKELEMVKIPFENGSQLYYHRKWLAILQGSRPPSKAMVLTWARRWLKVFNQASAVNFSDTAPSIQCPTFFFIGKNDYQTHFKITEDFYKTVKAEKKDLFWFTNSGHNLNLTEPKKLQEIIISLQKPRN